MGKKEGIAPSLLARRKDGLLERARTLEAEYPGFRPVSGKMR